MNCLKVTYMLRVNLQVALDLAIKQKEELGQGDSALVEGWRENLRCLRLGSGFELME